MNMAVARQEDIAFQANLYSDPNPTRRGLHRVRRDWVQARLAERATRGSKVLEVGIGCGIFTRGLSDMAANVTAFVEGAVWLIVRIQNMDTADAIATLIDALAG